MFTIPVLDTAAKKRAYHNHLQSDHDYTVWVDVLTLEEKRVGSVDLLDGQVNVDRSSDGPTRTGSLVLSDPDGALSFGTRYASDDTGTLWVNRLVRVHHEVVVPSLGPVGTVVGVGVPTAVARSGGEVSVEWGDKSLLADHGVRPRTYKKGANVRNVLVSLLRDLTGERKFRIPATKRRLSKPYSVGMGEDNLTPWGAFVRIARREANWRAYYSADGYATCEPASKAETIDMHAVLSLPEAATSFTGFINYVKVTSTRKTKAKKKKGAKKKDVTTVFTSVAQLPAKNPLSEQSLARNGVPRTLPLLVSDNDLKNKKQVAERARLDLLGGSGADSEQTYEVIPVFHLDVFDRLRLPADIGTVEFDRASVPLGIGGNMTLGTHRWVSAPVKVKRVRSKTTVKRKRKKGGKKNG